ncbi:MAG: hypothetical protein MUO72_17705 [Bacteroidales bacterium]|nr:hypothetical protein [Bacteroidales bacterium]
MEGSLYNTDNLLLENATKTRIKTVQVPSLTLSPSVETATTDKVSVFRNVISLINPEYLVLADVVARICDGHSKELVTRIRQGEKHLKLRLPAICFSGEFIRRCNAGLVAYSKLLVLDYDDVPDVQQFKDHIYKNPFVRVAFISPSGKGIKIIIRISGDLSHHAEVCKRLGQYFPSECLDLQNDISRICFESWDPEVYFNSNSRIFK